MLVVALASSSTIAQQKGQKGKAPAGPQVRYFDLSSGIFSDLSSEAILKENRQGNTLVSAELEVCHQASPTSNRLDRFVVPLKVEGNRLTGSGQSLEGKQAVSVNLTRRVAGGNFNFEGTVTSGSNTEKVQSTDNNEMIGGGDRRAVPRGTRDRALARRFHRRLAASAALCAVDRAALAGLLDALRDQNVRVAYSGLIPSCRVLRSGHYTVQIDVEAERIGAVFAKLKSVPGVTEAGFPPTRPTWRARCASPPPAGAMAPASSIATSWRRRSARPSPRQCPQP